MFFSKFVFLILFFFSLVKSHANLGYDIKKPDSWVKPFNLKENLTNEEKYKHYGFYYYLINRQIKKEEKEKKFYVQITKKLTNQKGVEQNSTIEIQYNPNHEFLTFHTIQIIRGTQVINQLFPKNIKVLQRENELEKNLYNGQKSLLIILNDVRVGDVIEYSYTLKDKDPSFNKAYYSKVYFSSDYIPIQRAIQRFLWPKNEEITLKDHRTSIKPKITQYSDYKEYLWDQKDLPLDERENKTPIWYRDDPFTEVGTPLTWQEVVKIYKNFYNDSPVLSEEIQAYLKEITHKNKDAEKRFLSVTRFIQDEIRYMGLEEKFKPDDPSLVFKRRFGDCKDKTLLALTLLKRLNIEAYPALVHTTQGKLINEWLPSPYHFNHVIIVAFINGKPYWIDPTHSLQRGDLNNFIQPDYGFALILDQKTTGLTSMVNNQPVGYRYKVYETIKLPREKKKSVHFVIKKIFLANEADSLRRVIHTTDPKELNKQFLEIFQKSYPKAKSVKDLQITDDEINNQITTIGEYESLPAWERDEKKMAWCFNYDAYVFRSYLAEENLKPRTTPLTFEFPVHDYQETNILLPDDNWNLPTTEKEFKHDSFYFKKSELYKGKTFKITYEFKSLKDYIDPKQIDSYKELSKKIKSMIGERLLSYDSPVAKIIKDNSINWIMVFLLGFTFIVSVIFAIWIYYFQPKYLPPIIMDSPLNRMRGWLLFFILTYALFTLLTFFGVYESLKNMIFSNNWLYPKDYNPSINPQFIIILKGVNSMIEIMFTVVLIPLSLLLLKRRRKYPYFYCIYLDFFIIWGVLYYYFYYSFNLEDRNVFVIAEIILSICFGIIRFYFQKSKRVKAVFIND